jgi:hypothetical protein
LKTLIRLLLFLLVSVLVGLWLAKPATAQAPSPIADEVISEDIIIKDNAISAPTNIVASKPTTKRPIPVFRGNDRGGGEYGGRHYSREEVVQLIKDYSERYGIHYELPLRIAKCESGYNQFSKNRSSTASGVFQYLRSTWSNTQAGKKGISVFDAEANIKMAVSHIATHGTSPWNSSIHCWK